MLANIISILDYLYFLDIARYLQVLHPKRTTGGFIGDVRSRSRDVLVNTLT